MAKVSPRMKINESPGRKDKMIVDVSKKMMTATPNTAKAPIASMSAWASSGLMLTYAYRLRRGNDAVVVVEENGVVRIPRF